MRELYAAAQTLIRALGLLPNLPPYDKMASHELLKEVRSEDMAAFSRAAKLREQAEVDTARDLAEIWLIRETTSDSLAADRLGMTCGACEICDFDAQALAAALLGIQAPSQDMGAARQVHGDLR